MALTKIVTNVITDDAITAAKIADGTIVAADLAANSVDSSELVNGSVDLAHMSVNSIDSDQYVDGSIDLAHMSVNSIDSDQYVDGSIDTAHINDLKVTTAKIAADAITGAKIADDAIDSEHYAAGSIDTAHIADDQVTLAKMAGLARGKIIYGDSSGNPAALAVGSNNQVLKSDGTDISWGASPAAISSYTNSTNNRVITSVDGSTVNAEANLTFDGSLLTVTGEVSMTTLDIGGTNVTATAAELNYVDGVTSAIQTQLNSASSKGFAIASAIVFG